SVSNWDTVLLHRRYVGERLSGGRIEARESKIGGIVGVLDGVPVEIKHRTWSGADHGLDELVAVQSIESGVASRLVRQNIRLALVRGGANVTALGAVNGDALIVRDRSVEVGIHFAVSDGQLVRIVCKDCVDVAKY